LLDYKLNELDIEPDTIRGYEREEYTHLAIAAAIEGGIADVGLGIFAAAKAMDLDFIPLLLEEYDLIIPSDFYDSPLLCPLLNLIRSEEFKNEVKLLGGYDTSNMGKIIAKVNRIQN
jgi:putative molybdopterin biosynthesis protein